MAVFLQPDDGIRHAHECLEFRRLLFRSGHPLADAFHNHTRDAAEVLMASISTLVDTLKSAREYVSEAVNANGGVDACEIHYRYDLEAIDNALAKFGVAKPETVKA